MNNLLNILRQSFGYSCYSGGGYSNPDADDKSKYMVIPIDKEIIEVPVFALYAFDKGNSNPSALFDEIVIKLNYVGVNNYYKTIDAEMRDKLTNAYSCSRLTRLPKVGDPERTYYITQGAIFDDDFNPIMMLTWEICRKPRKDSLLSFDYMFMKPILRIIPEVIINKSNALERYIVNKIMPNVLSISDLRRPYIDSPFFSVSNVSHRVHKPKVVIEKIPFEIKKVDVPSVSTTNEELMKVALDNLEELI